MLYETKTVVCFGKFETINLYKGYFIERNSNTYYLTIWKVYSISMTNSNNAGYQFSHLQEESLIAK